MKLRSKLTFIAFLCLFAPCQSKEQALLLLNVEACAVDESIAKILISVGRYETRVPGGKLRKADLALQDLHILHISLHELRSREKAAIHFSQLILPIDCNEISLATPFNNKLREGAFFLDFPFGYAISSGRYNAWELENSPTKWRILGGFPSVFLPTYETFQRYGDVLLSSRYPTDIRDRALKITDTAALRRVSRAIVEAPSKPRLRILTAGNWALVIAEHPTQQVFNGVEFDGANEILLYESDSPPARVECKFDPRSIIKATLPSVGKSPILIVDSKLKDGVFLYRTTAYDVEGKSTKTILDSHYGNGVFAFNSERILYVERELPRSQMVVVSNESFRARFSKTNVTLVDASGSYTAEIEMDQCFHLTDDGLVPQNGIMASVTRIVGFAH